MKIPARLAPTLDRFMHRGRARTLAIWAGSVLAVYAIAGFLVAPPVVRNEDKSYRGGEDGYRRDEGPGQADAR